MSDQVNHNPEGENIALHFNVLTNVFERKEQFRAELIIANQSAIVLKNNWSIYFNFLRKIIPNSVSKGFKIEHINGDYFSLKPTEDFTHLAPNEKVTIEFTASFWAIKKVDAPTGFYIVYHNIKGKESKPQSLPRLSIGVFNRPEQVIRTLNDIQPVPTAESRFELGKAVSTLPKESLIPILPTPVFFEKKEGVFCIKSISQIAHQAHLKSEALFLANFLSKYFDKPLEIVEGTKGDILLSTERVRVDEKLEAWNTEAYTINIDDSGVDMVGAGAAAVFYAMQSFIQLLNIQNKAKNSILEVPFITVQDKPQFAYRGIHLDVSRNFHGVETIKKLVEMLSFYKINKFHFHLTDDEGWRIEIPDLPELTEIGSKRGHTSSETECLLPSYGSGFDSNDPNSPGNGFYNCQEFIDLLRHAHDHHIEVIPAIDFPGHARAAVRAMEVRHDKYRALGNIDKANEYLLTDWDDTSEYESVQMWRRNVINIGLPSTYRFIEKIVDELLAMYAEADVKLSTIHIGGDEVPAGSWLQSPVCQNLMHEQPELQNIHDLTEYFMGRVNDILTTRGVQTAGWEEIALTHKNGKVEPNPALLKHNLKTYSWNTIWGEDGVEIPYKLANLGYQVVLSNAPSLYFDLAYDKDPEESGYYWAGYTDTEDTFKFSPMDFFKNDAKDALGKVINTVTHYQNAERLTKKGRENILGLQGQLWGETIKNGERIEYLLFPRMCALAERAWSKEPAWTSINDLNLRKKAYAADWNQFANRLAKIELPRLDNLFGGVRYRIPMPGAKLENGLLVANTTLPGLTIRYTIDGSEPTFDSPIYENAIQCNNQLIKLKTFTSNDRSSRTTLVKGQS